MIEDTAISARAIGQYQLSIATSLAIESLMGIHPEIKVSKPPINEFKELWVNVKTLFRNLMGSMHKDSAAQADRAELVEALWYECETIRAIIKEGTTRPTNVVFYVSDYKGMESKYKHAVLRRDNTDKAKDYTQTQNKVIERLLKEHPENFLTFDLKLKATQKVNTVILTHYPYDLFSRKEFLNLVLLESHTGALKTPDMWYTKYYEGKDIPFIPFREDLIQIFGDKEHFRPMDIKIKREVIELAQEKRWSAVTTTEKIKSNINDMKNPMSKAIIKDLLIS